MDDEACEEVPADFKSTLMHSMGWVVAVNFGALTSLKSNSGGTTMGTSECACLASSLHTQHSALK